MISAHTIQWGTAASRGQRFESDWRYRKIVRTFHQVRPATLNHTRWCELCEAEREVGGWGRDADPDNLRGQTKLCGDASVEIKRARMGCCCGGGENQSLYCTNRHFPSGKQREAWATVGSARAADLDLAWGGEGEAGWKDAGAKPTSQASSFKLHASRVTRRCHVHSLYSIVYKPKPQPNVPAYPPS